MVAPRGGDSSDGMCFRDRSAVQVPGSSTTASRKESMVPTLPGVRIILTSSDILQDFFFGKPCSVALKCSEALRLNTAFAEGFCCKMPEERQMKSSDPS